MGRRRERGGSALGLDRRPTSHTMWGTTGSTETRTVVTADRCVLRYRTLLPIPMGVCLSPTTATGRVRSTPARLRRARPAATSGGSYGLIAATPGVHAGSTRRRRPRTPRVLIGRTVFPWPYSPTNAIRARIRARAIHIVRSVRQNTSRSIIHKPGRRVDGAPGDAREWPHITSIRM